MGAKAKKALKKNMKKISASASSSSSQLAVPQNPKPSADFLVFSSMLSRTSIVFEFVIDSLGFYLNRSVFWIDFCLIATRRRSSSQSSSDQAS